MIHLSPLNKRKYLYELRERMSPWSDFGLSRFTGLILGSFFYITNHSQFEWDRRNGSPKCRAIGFVTKSGDETQVWAICTYGDIDPITMVRNFLIWFLLVFFILTVETLGPVSGNIIDLFSSILTNPQPYLCGAAFTVLVGLGTAIGCWWTERGRENMYELRILLENPMCLWEDGAE